MEDVYPSTHHANNCVIANEERATNEYENALLVEFEQRGKGIIYSYRAPFVTRLLVPGVELVLTRGIATCKGAIHLDQQCRRGAADHEGVQSGDEKIRQNCSSIHVSAGGNA